MKSRTSLFTMALAILLSAGCSKNSVPETGATPQKITDLGVVEVSNGVQSRHDLGSGRVCIIIPTVLPDGSVKLAMVIEQSGRKIAAPMITTLPDRAVEISVGEIGVGLTPHIKK